MNSEHEQIDFAWKDVMLYLASLNDEPDMEREINGRMTLLVQLIELYRW